LESASVFQLRDHAQGQYGVARDVDRDVASFLLGNFFESSFAAFRDFELVGGFLGIGIPSEEFSTIGGKYLESRLGVGSRNEV